MVTSTGKQGFTLLELLIVCLLISISLGLSIPSLRSTLITDDLASGSRKVISLIKSARAKAVTNREPYLIFYDSAERKLWYRKANAADASDAHSSITLPAGVRIEEIKQASEKSGRNPALDGLWISKQGYMDETGIQLTDKGNSILSLLISPFLPDIQVTDEAISFK